MAVYTLLILVAAIAQLAGANLHMQKLDYQVMHHSNLLLREFENRLNEGAKVAVYDSKKVPAVDPVHHSQELSALEPSAEPTAQPSENQNLSATGYVYLTQSFNEDCSQPVVSLGVPVNTCLVRYRFAYKVRIVDGNAFLLHSVLCLSMCLTVHIVALSIQRIGAMLTSTITVTYTVSSSSKGAFHLFLERSAANGHIGLVPSLLIPVCNPGRVKSTRAYTSALHPSFLVSPPPVVAYSSKNYSCFFSFMSSAMFLCFFFFLLCFL